MKKRSQASFELLIVLGIMLVIFMIMFAISNNVATSFTGSVQTMQAKDALDKIEAAAKYVYQQGEGATQIISLSMPVGIRAANLSGTTASITVDRYGSNYTAFKLLPFTVIGSLPTSPGLQQVIIKSMRGYVIIGNGLLFYAPLNYTVNSTINPNYLIFELDLINPLTTNITVNITANHPSFNILLDGNSSLTNLVIAPNSQRPVGVNVSYGASTYTGTVLMNATSSQGKMNITMPVVVVR